MSALQKGYSQASSGNKAPAVARPSSSVLLISPQHTILLLHRVQKSSTFPSAHVFPGGNLDPFHDGDVPEPNDPARHQDGPAYRMGAIRELFEESGLVLAKNRGFGTLLEVDEATRDAGRKLVHSRELPFQTWLQRQGGYADVDGLVPITRWITPTNIPKRFTTQMYLYFMPLASSPTRPSSSSSTSSLPIEAEAMIPKPTHDGGIEHTAARFLPATEWIEQARAGSIILFPPQLFLLHLLAPFLDVSTGSPASTKMPYADASTPDVSELQRRRQKLRDFVKTSDPPWGEKCISPVQVFRRKSDRRTVLGLDKPGLELEGSDRRGDSERVVLVNFRKEGPRDVEVAWRKDVFEKGNAESLKL